MWVKDEYYNFLYKNISDEYNITEENLIEDDKYNSFNDLTSQINNEYYFKKKEKKTDLEKLKTNETINKKQEFTSDLIKNQNENIVFVNQIDINGNNLPFLNEELINIPNSQKSKKGLGRKRHNSSERGVHNRYSSDNLIRKVKSHLLNILFGFINCVIMNTFNGNIGQGIYKKQLLKINQGQIVNGKNDKEFLKKNLKDIFSDDISSKYAIFPVDHNKNLIENLLNEEDSDKRKIFEDLFNLAFIDCLKHFRGDKDFDALQGLEKLDNVFEKFEDDDEYLELFKYYVFHFEEVVMNKRTRDR